MWQSQKFKPDLLASRQLPLHLNAVQCTEAGEPQEGK